MEAATDLTRPAESAQASSPTTRVVRGPQPYRQDPGSILLVATPIGDVRDASPRVVAALEGADIVAAEDTRRTLALASRLGIKLGGRLIALHDHNEAEKAAGIVEAARGGARVVFVSDAGMPTVSDPMYKSSQNIYLIKIKQNLNNLYNEVKLHQTIRQYFFHDPIPDSGL